MKVYTIFPLDTNAPRSAFRADELHNRDGELTIYLVDGENKKLVAFVPRGTYRLLTVVEDGAETATTVEPPRSFKADRE